MRRREAIENILQRCLARIEAGESIAACLHDYPEHADELAPLLEAVAELRGWEPPRLSAAARDAARTRAHAALAAQRERPTRRWAWAWSSGMRLALGSTLVLMLLLGTLGIGIAAAQSSMPGQPLYGLKRQSEELRLQLAQDAEQQAELRLQFAGRRLEEALAEVSDCASATDSLNDLAKSTIRHGEAITQLDTAAQDTATRAFRGGRTSAPAGARRHTAACHQRLRPRRAGTRRACERRRGKACRHGHLDIYPYSDADGHTDTDGAAAGCAPHANIGADAGANRYTNLRAVNRCANQHAHRDAEAPAIKSGQIGTNFATSTNRPTANYRCRPRSRHPRSQRRLRSWPGLPYTAPSTDEPTPVLVDTPTPEDSSPLPITPTDASMPTPDPNATPGGEPIATPEPNPTAEEPPAETPEPPTEAPEPTTEAPEPTTQPADEKSPEPTTSEGGRRTAVPPAE